MQLRDTLINKPLDGIALSRSRKFDPLESWHKVRRLTWPFIERFAVERVARQQFFICNFICTGFRSTDFRCGVFRSSKLLSCKCGVQNAEEDGKDRNLS